MAMGSIVILRRALTETQARRIMIHESIHVKQAYFFGTLAPLVILVFYVYGLVPWWSILLSTLGTMPVLYFFNSVLIYFTMPKHHAYLGNLFERFARKAAGQKIRFTKEEFKNQHPFSKMGNNDAIYRGD